MVRITGRSCRKLLRSEFVFRPSASERRWHSSTASTRKTALGQNDHLVAGTAPDLGSSSSPPMTISRRSSKRWPRDLKPFSSFLTDNFQRQHTYLRISVTERCNLRCLYCMPEEGVVLTPEPQNLTTPEIVYLSRLFVDQGVTKIRLTGGEPTVRKDFVDIVRQIGSLRSLGLKELCLTTNGLTLNRKLDALVEAGLTNINLSLDTLDPHQFNLMTRRDGFSAVWKSIEKIFDMKRTGHHLKFKINCVVIRGLNDHEVVPFAELGRDDDVEIRFIEYMPFDGNRWAEKKMVAYQEILQRIATKYPGVDRVIGHPNDTSKIYQIPGFAGRVGFVTSMTENFCGTCNRLRITSDGNIKVCLFGTEEFSLRDVMREENGGMPLDEAWSQSRGSSSHANIDARLLEIIGMAVGRKKKEHAGLAELKAMENRPMITIGG